MEAPDKFKDLIGQIESLTVLELNELVKALETKFGVSAAALTATPTTAPAGGEEKESFALHLTGVGGNKIAVIKVLKEALGLGLKEAKDLVDAAPVLLKEGLKKDEAAKIKKQIEEAGGQAELK